MGIKASSISNLVYSLTLFIHNILCGYLHKVWVNLINGGLQESHCFLGNKIPWNKLVVGEMSASQNNKNKHKT